MIKIVSDITHKDKPYGIITEREQIWAGRLLNDKSASHILYYYIALNQDGYCFALSPTALHNRYGISEKSYRNGIKKLKEVGYLVQKKQSSNIWCFYRVPERFKDSDVFDWSPSPKYSEPSYTNGTGTLSLKGSSSTLYGTDEATFKGERNNINTTNIINSTSKNLFINESDNHSPERENHADISSLENECDNLISKINSEFGYLDSTSLKLMSAEYQSKKFGSGQKKLREHFKLLSRIFDKAREERSCRAEKFLSEYQEVLKSTVPTDIIEQMKVNLIFDKYIKSHSNITDDKKISVCPIKLLREKYGAWINGWNEELQEPNILIATSPLPLGVIKKQRHNTAGIPSSYWKNK